MGPTVAAGAEDIIIGLDMEADITAIVIVTIGIQQEEGEEDVVEGDRSIHMHGRTESALRVPRWIQPKVCTCMDVLMDECVCVCMYNTWLWIDVWRRGLSRGYSNERLLFMNL